MLTLIIRSTLIYLLVLLVFRLMGKRQIGQMQPFELVLTLIIADLATIPMTEISIPILHGVVPLITLVVVHFFLTFISKKSTKVGEFISGKPIVIINPNGIDYKSLQELDITIDDLFEAIRTGGHFNLEEIQYAIMETNGSLSVLPKSAFEPATNSTLKLKAPENTVPVTLVSEGLIVKNNLENAKLTKTDIEDIMKKAKIPNIKDILVLTINKTGSIYIQAKNKPFKTFTVDYKGENLT
ncbi:MAG: DUF421 domain-containing protein [Clostridia bacterium]|nr:DUF421 domain-containing protein [Clostridia bacterium]